MYRAKRPTKAPHGIKNSDFFYDAAALLRGQMSAGQGLQCLGALRGMLAAVPLGGCPLRDAAQVGS